MTKFSELKLNYIKSVFKKFSFSVTHKAIHNFDFETNWNYFQTMKLKWYQKVPWHPPNTLRFSRNQADSWIHPRNRQSRYPGRGSGNLDTGDLGDFPGSVELCLVQLRVAPDKVDLMIVGRCRDGAASGPSMFSAVRHGVNPIPWRESRWPGGSTASTFL